MRQGRQEPALVSYMNSPFFFPDVKKRFCTTYSWPDNKQHGFSTGSPITLLCSEHALIRTGSNLPKRKKENGKTLWNHEKNPVYGDRRLENDKTKQIRREE